MKTVKQVWVAIAVMILALGMGATVSQATTLTLQSSHTLTPTVTDTTTSTALGAFGGTISAGVDGNSYWTPSQNPSANSQTGTLSIGTNQTVNATLGSLTWLNTTAAYTSYIGSNNTFTMAQQYIATAPNSFSSVDGYVIQYGSLTTIADNVPTYFSLTYTLTAGHNYHVSLVDAYSFLYQLVNSAGPTNLFDNTYGKLLLNASISYTGGNYTATQYIVGADAPDVRSGTPVSNFTLANGDGNATLALDITNAGAGTLTFSGYLVAEDYGYSYTAIPLPSTMLLLGSGLVGLGLLRRKWSLKK